MQCQFCLKQTGNRFDLSTNKNLTGHIVFSGGSGFQDVVTLSCNHATLALRNEGENDIFIGFSQSQEPTFPLHPTECIILDDVTGNLLVGSPLGSIFDYMYVES